VNNLPFPATPAMSRRFRLQWEDAQQCHVLLYPEGMVKLNTSAAEILKCCDGKTPVDQIVSGLETKFQATGLRADIESLLTHAYQHKWIE
jgi:pyrroloquinoline quinone biosynthesis protein D